MAMAAIQYRAHSREYNIGHDGNQKPTTHPHTDCLDFAHPGGTALSTQENVSC